MSESDRKLKELHIPPAVWEDPDARELLRAWAADKSLHVSFRTDWREPGHWGIFLADVARHAARALASESVGSEDSVLAQIQAKFDEELVKPTDLGSTSKFKRH